MRQIIPEVYLLEGLRGANVYLLVSDGDLILVDSGLNSDADKILAQLQAAGFSHTGLSTIILTHAHGDHSSGVAALVKRSGAQILAHQEEVPYIEGTRPLPFPSPVQRALVGMGNRFFLGMSTCRVNKALADGETLNILGGSHVVHTPGHTPGSICLYQPDKRILFCGDVLFHQHPITGQERLRFPIPFVTVDMEKARESVRKLSNLNVETLCFGHGQPILAGAGEMIEALLDPG